MMVLIENAAQPWASTMAAGQDRVGNAAIAGAACAPSRWWRSRRRKATLGGRKGPRSGSEALVIRR